MMGRHIAVVVILVLTLTLVAGCGGSTPTATPTVAVTSTAAAAKPIALPTPTKPPIKFYKITGTQGMGLNIREQPDVNAKQVARACEGAILQTRGEPIKSGEYSWVEVVGLGYAVNSFFVESQGPATTDEATDGKIKLICPLAKPTGVAAGTRTP
jgi:hypothetical protein